MVDDGGMEALKDRFQVLVDRFQLDKDGASPFDANKLDAAFMGASHGEKCAIQFLLHVWNPDEAWQCGPFDAIDAAGIWDEDKRRAFAQWMLDPFFP